MSERTTSGHSRLALRDILRVGSVGLRARRLRAALSALGICIGIAAIVAVQGVSTSSEIQLLNRIGALGNLLVVSPGKTFTNAAAQLPPTAPAMIRAVGPVTQVAATATLPGLTVRRTPAIPAYQTGSIAVQVADPHLPDALGVPMLSGVFLTPWRCLFAGHLPTDIFTPHADGCREACDGH